MKKLTPAGKCAITPRSAKIDQILVVDNDPVFLALLAKFLKNDGFHVLTAKDGAFALKILKSVTPDVILLDLVMPNVSGDRLCRMIREMDTAVKDAYILLVTAVASEGVTVDYLGMGANDCIAKVSFNQTYRRIRESLSRLEQRPRKKGEKTPAASAEVPPRSLIGELISINRNHEIFDSNISEGRLELTEEGRIIFANPAAVSLLGQPELDLISAKVTDFFRKEDRRAISQLLSFKKRRQAADGNTTFRLSNAREVTLKALHVAGEEKVTVILHDVTEQKGFERALLKAYADLETRVAERTAELAKANEALHTELEERRTIEGMLQQSRNTLRSVFDSISDPLIMVDRDLRIRMANRATVDYFRSADYLEILGKPFSALAQDHFSPDLLSSVERAILKYEESSFESNSFEKRGKYEKVFIYPTHEEYRLSGSAIVRISDITKEKIVTIELIQQEKLASLGLLVSSMTHEINNPNNFILFNVPILRDYLGAMLPIVQEHAAGRAGFEIMGMSADAFQEDALKLLTNIQNGAERICATAAKFVGFSKKRTCEKNEPVDPGEPIEKAVSICRHEINRTIRSFDVDVEANLPTILADPWALEQVIINLLINASQVADKADSRLGLKAFVDKNGGNRFTIEITDNGCGMDGETIKKIFFPFFTSKKDGKGTGLGLYIVKNLIDEMEGRIEVQSEPGRGSTFRIAIPVNKTKL
ncbi:MAG TPA: ATP-binding protein [Syntrophales bacterium]|nr:ATP-binding protein [Syntrophales bacterium]